MMFKLPFVVQVQAIYYFITVLGKNILYCYINIHPQTLKDINSQTDFVNIAKSFFKQDNKATEKKTSNMVLTVCNVRNMTEQRLLLSVIKK